MGYTGVLYIVLHIRWIFFHTPKLFLAIEQEEVAVQHGTDALQQYRVDSLALEDVVHISAVTVEALGKPRHAAPLAAQLSFNLFTDVYWHCSTNISRNGSLVATF